MSFRTWYHLHALLTLATLPHSSCPLPPPPPPPLPRSLSPHRCIECGFCESNCPSRDVTLTPRQRITVYREINRLQQLPAPSAEEANRLKEISTKYEYDGKVWTVGVGKSADGSCTFNACGKTGGVHIEEGGNKAHGRGCMAGGAWRESGGGGEFLARLEGDAGQETMGVFL